MATQHPLVRILSRSISSLLTLAAFTSASHAATKTWDGGAAGTGIDLATAANWSGDTLPVANDTLQWNGTVPGDLSLSLTASTAFAANNGYFIDVTAAQTGSLLIDNVTTNVSGNGIRLTNITIAAGAGAFSLGNGTGTSVLILGSGTAPANANTWTNNSSNAATIASDTIWANGGAVANRQLTLTGSGDWIMNAPYGITVTGGTGTLALTKTGAGTLFMNATATYTSGTTIGAGGGASVIRATANQALGTGTVVFDATGNASTARLELTGNIALNNAISFTGRTASTAIQNLSGSNTLSGVLTLGTGGSTYAVQSDSGTLTLSNTTSITGGATTGARVVTLQGAGDGVIGGAIINGSATVGITKAGAGTWTFNGTSTYTGPTTINAGTLQIGNGTVNGDITGGGAIVNNGTLLLNRSGTGTFTNASAITGTGVLTKLGTGTQILTGTNAYTGPTNINGGALGFGGNAQTLTGTITVADGAGVSARAAAAASTLLTASTIVIGASGTATLGFDFNALNTTAPLISTSVLTLNGTPALSFLAGAALTTGTHPLLDYTTLSGTGTLPTGPFTLSVRSVGTLVHDTTNTVFNLNVVGDAPKWTGLDGGTWAVGTTGANGNWKLVGANTATDYIDGDFVLFDDTAASNLRNVNLSATLSPVGTVVTNTTGGGAYTFSGAGKISGTGSLIKQGNGTLVITNTGGNDYTGGTTIGAGTLQIGDGATVGAGALSTTGAITNNGTLILNRPDDLTIPQAIGGTGSIVKNAAGTATFSAAAVNSTAYTINGGKLRFTGGGTLTGVLSGTGQFETTAGTFQLGGTTANTYTGLTTVSGGLLQLNKSTGVNAVGGDLTMTGTGQVTLLAAEQIADTATVTLLGTNADSLLSNVVSETVANVIVNSSTAGAAGGQIVMRSNFNVTGTATVTSGVLGVSSSHSATLNAVNITSAPGSNGILRIAGSGGASTLNVGPGGITASGGEIQVKFNTNNQDAILNLGGDFITTGNVIITNGAYTGANLNVINLTGPRTFNIGAGTTTTVAPDLAGPGSLTKSGNGTLTLNASVAATYVGDTTVNAGTLLLLGSISGSANVNVSAGTLGGSGSITSALGIGNGTGTQDSFLAPGAAPLTVGTLTTAAATFGGDSVFSLEINTDGTPATDLLSSTGAVTLSLGANLAAANIGTAILTSGQVFTFITGTSVVGQFANAPDGFILPVGANFFEVNYTGTSVQLIATVPEPSAALLLLSGSLLLFRRRRPSA